MSFILCPLCCSLIHSFIHSFIHSYMHACHVLYLCIITIITHQSLHHITQIIALAGIVGGGGGRTVATVALRRPALTADIAQRATSSAERQDRAIIGLAVSIA